MVHMWSLVIDSLPPPPRTSTTAVGGCLELRLHGVGVLYGATALGEGRHRRDAVRREAREPAAGLVELVSSAGESKGPGLKMFCGFLWHFYSGKVQEDPLLGECIGVTCVFFLKQIQDGNPKVWKIYCWSMQWVQHSSHLCVDSVS